MTELTIERAVTGAAVGTLEKLRTDIAEGLAGLDADALNWRPVSGGNSIAGLLSHMLEASTFLLSLGRGMAGPRDRDAQFEKVAADGASFLREVEAAWPAIAAAAQSYTGADLAAARDFRGRPVNGAWCLLHACDHMMEHWGQIQLTRDLYNARGEA